MREWKEITTDIEGSTERINRLLDEGERLANACIVAGIGFAIAGGFLLYHTLPVWFR